MVKIRRYKTLTEAENYLDYVFAKKAREKAAELEAQLKASEANAALANATQIEKANIARDGQVQSADLRKQATENAAAESAGVKEKAIQADLIKEMRKPQEA